VRSVSSAPCSRRAPGRSPGQSGPAWPRSARPRRRGQHDGRATTGGAAAQ
jgi:hypothetical protein